MKISLKFGNDVSLLFGHESPGHIVHPAALEGAGKLVLKLIKHLHKESVRIKNF